MRLWIAIALPVVLLAALLIFATRTQHDSDRSSSPASLPAPTGEPPTLRGAEPPGAKGARDDESRAAAAPGEARAADRILVEGTLAELQPDGAWIPVAKGRLRLRCWGAEGCREVTVEVIDGRWSLEVSIDVRLAPKSLTIDGKLAALDDDSHLGATVESNMTPLALRAEVIKPTRLRVIDAETGRDLDGLMVLRPTDAMDEGLLHPSEFDSEGLLLTYAASPITIPIWDPDWVPRPAVVWASRDGYAWGRIEFDMVSGGERVLALHRGGAVDVRLDGVPATEDMKLRIRADVPDGSRSHPIAEFQVLGKSRLDVECLPAGAYVGSVEIGDWYRKPRAVATGRFEIVAGERARLTLELAEVEGPPARPLTGTIVIPSAWNLERPSLVIQVAAAGLTADTSSVWLGVGSGLDRIPNQPDTWRFDAGRVPPCAAVLELRQTGYRTVVRVGAEKDSEARIVVPPPGDVSLRFIDASTGEDTAVGSIDWVFDVPGGGGVHMLETVQRSKASGRFDFRAPVGTIRVSMLAPELLADDHRIEVTAGCTERTLTVRRGGGVLIVLMDGEARIPHDSHAELLSEGRDFVYCLAYGHEGCVAWALESGRYRLHLSDVEGYEPIPDRDVQVEVGEQTRITIQLVRKR